MSARDERISCECGHRPADHEDSDGPCQGLDSYSQPCACPSYEEMSDEQPEMPWPPGTVVLVVPDRGPLTSPLPRPYRAKVLGYDRCHHKYRLAREYAPGLFTGDDRAAEWASPGEVEGPAVE